MNDSTTLWEQRTFYALCAVDTSVKSVEGHISTAVNTEHRVEQSLQRYSEGRQALSEPFSLARHAIREIAYRNLDVDVALSVEYLEAFFNNDEFANALRFSNPDFSFELQRPIKVITEKDPQSTCDFFGPDQIGLRAPATLATSDSSNPYIMTVHLGIGLDFSGRSGKFYVGHDAHLRDAEEVDPLILAFVETTINRKLRERLATQEFPAMDSDKLPLKNESVENLAAKVGKHLSVMSRITANEGYPPVRPHAPASPITVLEGWEHVVVKIAPFFVYNLMKDKLQAYIDNYPSQAGLKLAFKVDRLVGRTIPIPDPNNPTRRALEITTAAYCNNEFGDREDFGNVIVTAELEKRTARRGLELVMRPRVQTQTVLIPQITQEIEPETIMKLPDAVELKSRIENEGVSISIQYDLQQRFTRSDT